MTLPLPYRKLILPYAAWWLLWAVIQFVVLHRFDVLWCIAITDAVFSVMLLALAGYIIENIFRFYKPASGKYLYCFGCIVALTILCVGGSNLLLQYLFPDNISYIQFLEASLPVRYMFSLLMISFIGVVSWLRFYMKEQAEQNKRKDDALLLMRDAELSKLQQQLQPHFLFNSLNSISSLAGTRPEEARKMIQQLSDFLRGTLKKDDQQLVALAEELQHLQLYLEIEKVRFGHRLSINTDYAEAALQMKLPSLLLQPIVENSIKFGLYDTTGEIQISIQAKVKDGMLHLTVTNPFDAETAKPRQGMGFGLNSVQRRLYLLYARNDLLHVEQAGNHFITSLTIPQNK